MRRRRGRGEVGEKAEDEGEEAVDEGDREGEVSAGPATRASSGGGGEERRGGRSTPAPGWRGEGGEVAISEGWWEGVSW